jgi:diaminohydroxyphosphoribosylaminopyrimidine deaminase/5-amino-6-(5-phosphoribosylamino)uracil reductase
VSGKGYAILRAAGIEVVERILAADAADQMAGYLTRSLKKRPEVTLKLAISADGMIGRLGEGQVAITGPVSRAQVHLMRAESDAILVGINTAIADDPELTVRLDGLACCSPIRIILDPNARLPVVSKLAGSAARTPVWLAACGDADVACRLALESAGVRILAAELYDGRLALPEFLEDLAGQGISTVMVEGGRRRQAHFWLTIS